MALEGTIWGPIWEDVWKSVWATAPEPVPIPEEPTIPFVPTSHTWGGHDFAGFKFDQPQMSGPSIDWPALLKNMR